MTHPDHLFLYVDRPEAAADLYHKLFRAPIVASAPTFALVVLPSGLKLGLWARFDVEPVPAPGAGGFELGGVVESDAAVEGALAEAEALGCRLVQAPVGLPFGYTGLVLTPDGHALRVYHPGAPAAS